MVVNSFDKSWFYKTWVVPSFISIVHTWWGIILHFIADNESNKNKFTNKCAYCNFEAMNMTREKMEEKSNHTIKCVSFDFKTIHLMVKQSVSDQGESQVTKCKFNGFLPTRTVYYRGNC